nr:hypothetical protein [Tanacetum cinerariifolium]
MSAIGELTFFLGLQVQTATTPYEAPKPKYKSESDSPVNVYLYRSMIGSIMYLTALRPDIMFAVSACSRHQVTPTTSNLESVKKIFKYLKGQPKLGLWYPKESPLVLEAYNDNDYARANKDKKSTTGGCQFLAQTLNLTSTIINGRTQYKVKHNKVGYLLQPTGSDDYHNIIDFLWSSHIRMDNLGSVTEGKLTFFKNKFSPQWRFLVHTLLHCLSTKPGSWDQFGNPLPLLPAMLLQAQAGEGAEVAAQDVPHPVPALDQSPAHFPIPSRPQTFDPIAPVLEHDHSSDQHETAAGSFPTREDAPMGGDFHTSPPRSSYAPPAGQPSRGLEDPITLTALSSVVSTLVQKVHSLEAELHDHKKLFKDVVGNTTQNVDLDALRALANAAVVVDSDIPSGSTLQILAANPCAHTAVSLGASVDPTTALVVPTDSPKVPTAVTADSPTVPTAVPADTPNVPIGVSSKGKSLMVKEEIPIKVRTFRQMEEDRLGEEAAKRLHDEEMAHMERERAKAQRKRQQEILESAMFYNEADWLNIKAQVEANASLLKTLLGDDVSEDNFLARMAALIRQKRQALAEQLFKERQNRPMTLAQQKAYMRQYVKNQSSAIYNTGWTMAYVKSFSDEQLKQEFEKIRKTFLKVVVDEDSNDEDFDDEVWSAVFGWEVLPTPLGEINALYHIDGSSKHLPHSGERDPVWQNQHLWEIQSWRLYTLSNVHVLETVFGEVLSMFIDVSYPLSVKLMERMLFHKLEIDSNFVGNDLTTAEQVFNSPMLYLLRIEMVINSPWIMPILEIQELASPKPNGFCPEQTAIGKDISNPFMAVMICQKSLGYYNSPLIRVLRVGLVINPPGYVVPTGRVIVPTGRYIVPTGRVIVATGRLEEDLVSYFQNFQNTSESSDDSTNDVNAPREPFVVKQDHGVKSSQNPPPIDECYCECGNALDGIFCQ